MVLSNINEPGISELQPNKRKKKKSIVWEHFTTERVDPGCIKARCNQCKKPFSYISGSKLAGTSHLKRHISLGICPASRQKNQPLPSTPGLKSPATADPPKKRYQRGSPIFPNFNFDQSLSNSEIAKMIILHEYPLNIVEQPGFVTFLRALQPQFSVPSFNTVQGDCVAMYLKEKRSLSDLIGGIPGKVSLALDLWISNQSLGYIFVTGHFIDGDWNLHRRILNVVVVPSLDSADSFNHAVAACLADWKMEGRLFTLTLDQAFVNETAFENLRTFLPHKNQILLSGQLLIGNCFARVLSRLAQDALERVGDTVRKVRENVKYVKTSELREDKFLELKRQLQVPSSKTLSIDDLTRWDTTYHMLVAASELKEVFACLDTSDPDYQISPSPEEWNQIVALCSYLRYLFDAASVLTAPTYPTANVFFPELSKIQMDLMEAAMTSEDPFIHYLTRPLYENFDKYWSRSCLGLAVAVVMDPRFKMKIVEFTFSKIYGENAETWIRIVDDGVHELFFEYMTQMLSLPGPMIDVVQENIGDKQQPNGEEEEPLDGLSDFDIYISEITSHDMKSELDQYLEEPLLPRVPEFDVLSWWNENRTKYPTLSRMASDVLSIPISTVAPDSVFDTDVKKMDDHRTSLNPVTLEALVCAKDWLQHGSSTQTPSPSFQVTSAIVKMEF